MSAAGAPRAWLIEYLLLASVWGASFLFMRLGASEFGALPTAGLRVCVAAAI
ncbi:MAG: EamA/RhaT family transporter, partial [Rhodoferax sp.]